MSLHKTTCSVVRFESNCSQKERVLDGLDFWRYIAPLLRWIGGFTPLLILAACAQGQTTQTVAPGLQRASQPNQPSVAAEPSSQENTAAPIDWWTKFVSHRIRGTGNAVPADVGGLFALAVRHSQRIQAVRHTPWITGTQITQANGAFDIRLFNTTDFNSSSDPVESTLETGGPPRLEDDVVGIDGGLQGQMRNGSSFTAGQRIGHKNSNSLFFDPQDQASSRLYANWTHPMLRGRQVNPLQSLVLIAQFDTAADQAKYQQAVQAQLLDIAGAYWKLYVERASLLVRRENLFRAQTIAQQLEQRQELDTVRSQLLRARGAVANRKAELIAAEAAIGNVESQLRALVNAPGISDVPTIEIIPVQLPSLAAVHFDIESEVAAAVSRRPDIQELHQKLRTKGVELVLARDQTKAQLDFFLEGNLAGRAGNSNIGRAWADQFTTGRPGFGVGLVYELPFQNRTARGLVQQRVLERIQLQHLLNELLGNTRSEVETAVRNLEAARQTAIARFESVAAARAEVAYLEDRWRSLGSTGVTGQSQLNDLLDSHARLLGEELGLVQASAQHSRALVELQGTTGALVQFAR